MKYMLLACSTQAEFERFTRWSPEALRANTAYMRKVNSELEASGVLESTMALGFPEHARTVRAGTSGEPITDGLFPESKEFLAGFWIVNVDTEEEAFRIAARIAGGPVPQGVEGSLPIEVRAIMETAPSEWV